ncbi:hypothetical protein EDD86DRAFT_187490 [Gorgonomyces haynaldii]|nr:hypothetical protein EDD86DRAFT_187490 [Gorgonomyces haynaldii]
MHQDSLYHWKKHSGFKKGLATDIVMGNKHTSDEPVTTMHSDYVPKQKIDVMPAGKPIGFDTTDKTRNHIVFGDMKMSQDDRQKSVTEACFVAPKHIIIKPTLAKKEIGQSIAQQYHSKPITATSAAHIGLQTKQDLPIDDAFFSSFNTTAQDSYTDPTPDRRDTYRHINVGRPSHLVLGDMEKQRSYDTMHVISYKEHPAEAYQHSRRQVPQHVPIKLGHIDIETKHEPSLHYSTTTQYSYKQLEPLPQSHRTVGPSNASNIVFGEELESRRTTENSVTKRDFTLKEGAREVKRVNNPESGIDKALKPTSLDTSNFEPESASSFRPMAKEVATRLPAAGYSRSDGTLVKQRFTSFVPTGDAKHYDFSSFSTTSKDTFHEYEYVPPKHPALGANMTISNVTFGDYSNAPTVQEQYSTSTQREFVAYPKSQCEAARGRRIPPHAAIEKLSDGFACPLSTTHQHFYAPTDGGRRHPILPQVAHRNKLFPVKNVLSFETTSGVYYGYKPELYQIQFKKEQPSKQANIVMGDPRVRLFERPAVV